MPFSWAGAAGGAQGALRQQQQDAMELENALAERAYRQALIQQQEQQNQRLMQQMQLEREKFTADQAEAERATRERTNQRGAATMVGEFIRGRGNQPMDQGTRNQIVGTLVEAGRMPTAADFGTEAPEQFTLGPGQVRFDAAGQQVAAGPTPASALPSADPFTLGRGQVRYDAQGNEIARGEAFPAPASGGQGGGVNTSSLPAAIKDDLITMGTLYDMSNQAEQLGNSIGWAGVGGMRTGSVAQFAAKNLGFGDKTGKEQELRNLIGNITATLARLRGGTSFTTNEQALLEQYTPTINDGDAVIQAKLRSLRQFVNTKRENTLRVAGGDLSMPTSGPAVGEQRMINGQRAEWDGRGWVPVGGR